MFSILDQSASQATSSHLLQAISAAEPAPLCRGVQNVWQLFEEICAIPHPSGGEKPLADTILRAAQKHSWKCATDAVNNLRIDVPGRGRGHHTAGGIVLQAHLDMVLKAADGRTVDDLFFQPVRPRLSRLDSDLLVVTATGTTLGADNGIGVAVALAIAADTELTDAPPIRILLTMNEERGLVGARALTAEFVTQATEDYSHCLGLDVGAVNELRCGSAGAQTTYLHCPSRFLSVSPAYARARILLDGFRGGHSGLEIHRPHANPICVLAGILADVWSAEDFRECCQLISIEGGSNRNSIPTFCFADVALPVERQAAFNKRLRSHPAALRIRQSVEPALILNSISVDSPDRALKGVPADEMIPILHAVAGLPHGVTAWLDTALTGGAAVPETSLNVARISTESEGLRLTLLPRSFYTERLDNLSHSLEAQCMLPAARFTCDQPTPGWLGNPGSDFADLVQQAALRIFSDPMKIAIRHSGQETGILAQFFPNGNIFGLGPTIKNHHEPDEYVEVTSVTQFYETVRAVLQKLA